jgi:hypothetical protein
LNAAAGELTMLDYPNNPKLLETAFEIVAQDYEHDTGDIQINGWNFNTTVDEDKSLLKLLAKSPVRWKIEIVRNMMNEALGTPMPNNPREEVAQAVAVIEKHLKSGVIRDFCYDGRKFEWYEVL